MPTSDDEPTRRQRFAAWLVIIVLGVSIGWIGGQAALDTPSITNDGASASSATPESTTDVTVWRCTDTAPTNDTVCRKDTIAKHRADTLFQP